MSFVTITLGDLKRIWVALVVCQLFGSVIGLALAPHHFAFLNFWLGGAIASPFGFALGLGWQLWDAARRPRTPVALTAFLGVLGLSLGGSACFEVLPDIHAEMQHIQALRTMDASRITHISVFDKNAKRKIAAFDSRPVVVEFAKSCRDAQGYSPGHPRYTSSWYVVLSGAHSSEIECHFESGHPDVLVGNFVTKSGNITRNHGSFSSAGLRKWFETHVVEKSR